MEEDHEISQANRLLPAWFVPRMMNDVWYFALLTAHGQAILIDHIDRVHQAMDGQLWLDVNLLESGSFWEKPLEEMGFRIITAPTNRTAASINATHVVAALEIANT